MEKVEFFIPAKAYRELIILKSISENPDISQEKLAKTAGIVPSMANRYVSQLEESGYVTKEGKNRKNMSYRLTNSGMLRFQFLTISYLQEISELLGSTNDLFSTIVSTINENNIRKCVLYGAGIIGGILAEVLKIYSIDIMAFAEDDFEKIGEKTNNIRILSLDEVFDMEYDAVIIASFRHMEKMLQKAKEKGLKKIYHFEITDMGSISLVSKGE